MNTRLSLAARTFLCVLLVFSAACGSKVSEKISKPENAGAVQGESLPATILVGVPSLGLYQTVDTLEINLTLVVTPGIAGENDVSLFFFDKREVIDQVVSVGLRLRYLDHEAGAVDASATIGHPGHAFLIGDHLRHEGRWQIEALVRRADSRETRASFEILVGR